MPNKSIINEYNKLVNKFKHQDSWRKGYYSGYEKNSFLEMRGYNEGLLEIDSKDTKEDIRNKINALQTITKKGDQQLVQLSSGDYYSKSGIMHADAYISQRNQEHYAMSLAMKDVESPYLTKNKYGDTILKQVKGQEPPNEVQYILNMSKGGLYMIEGIGTIGAGMPMKKRGETDEEYDKRIKPYKQWLNRQDKYVMKSRADFMRKKGVFRESSQVLGKERMHQLHLNIKSALFSKVKGSITIENSATKTLKKYLNTMTDKDVLYLFTTRQDLFDFSFLYSEEDMENKVQSLTTAIEDYRMTKKGYYYNAKGAKVDAPLHDSYVQWSKAIDLAYGK